LGIIESSADIGPLASTVPDNGGVFVVPAFTGLGSPWWDPYARGTIVGITRGTTRAHVARAVVEAMVFQTRDVVEAMTAASGTPLAELRVDGGAAVMNDMLQMQSDELGVPVLRPTDSETTALGAAYLAGLGTGVWNSMQEIADAWRLDRRFDPRAESGNYSTWLRAVERSRSWVRH
jgi:glycerol kinase